MTEAPAMALPEGIGEARRSVLRPLPRRAQVSATGPAEDYTLQVRRVRKPLVGVPHAILRAATWVLAAAVLALRLLRERLGGPVEPRRLGTHLRRFFETVGGTGIKIGQQLASRVDIFDFAVCTELSALVDRVPPFEFDLAKVIIERATGRPLTEVFESIDPRPIGSASVACVYRGILATGERVAIKVQRPGVAEQFAADVACIDAFTQTLEFLTLVRPGYFKHLRSELEHLFYQELDFVQEGRYQSLFRREARRAGIDWLSAPRVHHEYSSLEVLVSEYVDGVICSELVRAVETGDETALAEFARLDIEPKVVARRILYQAWWRRYEETFFHADPHPANIIVRPGSEIVMIDFGSCGITTARNRRNDLAYARYVEHDDISALVEIAINNAMPLPHIDVEEFRNRLERYLWQNRFAQISKDAEWWERTTAGVFLGLARANRDLNIPLVPNMLEIMRATLLYDTIALRLYPGFNLNVLFRRYLRKSGRRDGSRFRRRARRAQPRHVLNHLAAEGARLRDTLNWGRYWLESVTENLPSSFQLLSRKTAYVFSVMLRLAVNAGVVLGVAVGGAWILNPAHGDMKQAGELVGLVFGHPLFQLLIGAMGLQALRRIAYRLADPDPNN